MASAIGKALGYGSLGDSGTPADDDPSADVGADSTADLTVPDDKLSKEPKEEDAEGPSATEVLAMKQFERAKDPKAKAAALKSFLEACGLYGGDESY